MHQDTDTYFGAECSIFKTSQKSLGKLSNSFMPLCAELLTSLNVRLTNVRVLFAWETNQGFRGALAWRSDSVD